MVRVKTVGRGGGGPKVKGYGLPPAVATLPISAPKGVEPIRGRGHQVGASVPRRVGPLGCWSQSQHASCGTCRGLVHLVMSGFLSHVATFLCRSSSGSTSGDSA